MSAAVQPPQGSATRPAAPASAATAATGRAPCSNCYLGLMSGTSMDGVDAVLAQFPAGLPPRILAHAALPMPPALRDRFLELNASGPDELARAALAGNELAHLYAQACHQALAQAGCNAADVAAIGAHGQTVRHEPAAGYTIQINAPALLAELTGIAVIADFRSRDVAAGGQGAPLVPAFHQAVFGALQPRVVLNLGGIANITVLHPGRPPQGFDTGPANILLDAWCRQHTGKAYDADGLWAASGTCLPALLALLLDEPWLAQPPPKSTGRHLFNLPWLHGKLARLPGPMPAPQDVQATLLQLTASTVAQAVLTHAPGVREVWVCGGGAHNGGLMTALQQALPVSVQATEALGVPAQCVEALAFAWLARAYEQGEPAGLPAVTGARGPRVLGCRYPA